MGRKGVEVVRGIKKKPRTLWVEDRKERKKGIGKIKGSQEG